MEYDLFQRIIDEGVKKGLCAVKLQIRGESFLHPRIFDCIAYAKEQGIMDVQITTNGTLLNTKNIRKILQSGLDAIIFSVDSHHGSSFNLNTRQNYSAVERKIKNLLETRSRIGASRPWVRLRSSITQTHIKYLRQTKAYLKKKFPEADIYIVGRIHDFRDDTDSFPDLHTSYDMQPCAYLMQRLAIFWNGDITTCCMDYNGRFRLGNVHRRTIQEIWLSEKMTDFRKLHMNNLRATMPICKHCHACLIARDPKIVQDNTARHPSDYQ
jgi:radical SAM protein with 4Fe4S-binding SPASM domain